MRAVFATEYQSGAGRLAQKDKNNGAVLFVFVQDRIVFLLVG
jgi:hypothetical protein